MINKWQGILGLQNWDISSERISKEQVCYPDDMKEGERSFIGVSTIIDNKIAVIHHDTDLYEEAIIHELLHVKYPKKGESWVNMKTQELILNPFNKI